LCGLSRCDSKQHSDDGHPLLDAPQRNQTDNANHRDARSTAWSETLSHNPDNASDTEANPGEPAITLQENDHNDRAAR